MPFSLLCAYPIEAFHDTSHAKPFADMSATHSQVIPAESYMELQGDAQLRVIAQLQQQAAALEAETIQRRHAEAELRKKMEQLADADRRKDEFLAMLGHELRNPLAPVTTALQLMRMHSDEPLRVARARETIERQVEHMTRLIDDLLDVSRITRGKIELRHETVVLSSLVARAVEAARPVIDERGHRLTLDLPDEPVTLNGDPARLEQVLANLLNNAAKYTDVGGRVWVRAVVEAGQVVISVKDNGAGLTPAMRDHVFDLFVQGPEVRAYARGGLGIGLTLVRRLVEMHGGTVEVRSDGPGQGSEFIVRLPVGVVSQVAPKSDATGAALAALPMRRILVVDDNVDAADALAELLRDYGHDVRAVHDGPSAIEQAAIHRPDIVLLDIGMPGFDGYEVARRMRTELGLKSTLVALTGYGEARHRRLSREAGFDQHVTKPVDIRKLEKLLNASELTRAPPPPPECAQRPAANVVAMPGDFDLVKERVDIVQLIGETVPLKKAGRGYVGLCPFHVEKTPSFHVDPERRTYKCFGCGEGGDIFTWLEKQERPVAGGGADDLGRARRRRAQAPGAGGAQVRGPPP